MASYVVFFQLFTGITCKQLSLNLTQYVVITKEEKQSYDFQENVTLSCKPGFTGKSMTNQCTDVDIWSANTPICTSKFVIVSYMQWSLHRQLDEKNIK